MTLAKGDNCHEQVVLRIARRRAPQRWLLAVVRRRRRQRRRRARSDAGPRRQRGVHSRRRLRIAVDADAAHSRHGHRHRRAVQRDGVADSRRRQRNERRCGGCHNQLGRHRPRLLATQPRHSHVGAGVPRPHRRHARHQSHLRQRRARGPRAHRRRQTDRRQLDHRLQRHQRPVDAGAPKPSVKPFAPIMGANTIDLSVLDPSLARQSITSPPRWSAPTSS